MSYLTYFPDLIFWVKNILPLAMDKESKTLDCEELCYMLHNDILSWLKYDDDDDNYYIYYVHEETIFL